MIICAAIKLENCPGYEDIVVPCWRHGLGYEILHNLMRNADYKQHTTEGFITDEGVFLNRVDSLDHAMKCGQLSATTRASKCDHQEDELYSEDLY